MLNLPQKYNNCKTYIYLCKIMKNKYNKFSRKRGKLISKYKMSNEDLADFFGYSSAYSFNRSRGKGRYLHAIECLLQHIESLNKEKQ